MHTGQEPLEETHTAEGMAACGGGNAIGRCDDVVADRALVVVLQVAERGALRLEHKRLAFVE